ncbi:hypothetical protein [Amycolatopsis sp. DG1A-15b]|uniref:hypothetical protein n=1 Tax=Amycolatopsis sp. DG1A-15b TaxID=3052846 RepID=UPI00255BAB07|nr:hypothetical protein [Amycolatopsis sp. DG1A-15b]WIX92529.1 hypothetical protein QRY02_19650 [Amycolatopsis sp. DG1A-15b]
MPVDDAHLAVQEGLPARTCRALRQAEQDYLRSGRIAALAHAEALLDGNSGAVADATRWWLSLVRSDRLDGQDGGAAADRCIADVADLADRHWAYRQVLAAALVRRCARDGDLGDLDRAIELWLTADADGGASALPLWLGPSWQAIELGTALLERFRLRATVADLGAAAELWRGTPMRSAPPVVRALRIGRLAACDHEEYGQTGQRRALRRAEQRYRRAIDALGDGAPARPILLTELGTVLQDRYEDAERRADLQEAIHLAESAVKLEPGTGADLACHLVNLGNAWEMVHAEDIDNHQALLTAVDCWRRALRHLPVGSPYRPAFLDRLALGLIGCVNRGLAGSETLDEALVAAREAAGKGAGSPHGAVYAANLADKLDTRWKFHSEIADLQEAVDVLQAAITPSSLRSAVGPHLAMNLVQLRISRYAELGDPADLEHALAELDHLAEVPSSRGQRDWWHGARAHLELMRYARGGRPTHLAAAIGHARRSLAGTPPGSEEYLSRSGYLASGLHWRYLVTGRKRDLDEAIAALRGRRDDQVANPDRLAAFLQERHERYGDPADGRAALHWAEIAAVGGEPTLPSSSPLHGLALVLHGRFQDTGRLADLDEAVRRHRDALAEMHSNTPVRPVVLSNLGITLQDRYIYGGDDKDLIEAIVMHEEALAAAPAHSPDRAGLLHSLAAAAQTRAEQSGSTAEAERAVQLDEQALESLPPSSPERAEFLANLAASRSMRARRTGRREDADQAIATFRAALARLPAHRPLRPHVIHGYARALAERYDRFGLPGDRQRAAAAHRRAVTAASANPVLLIDAASDWAEWSARQRHWSDAAAGWLATSAARWQLFGVQADPARGNSWLNRAEETASAGSLALVRCDRLREAVVMLDSGRALRLNQAIDHRLTIERLRRLGHPELGTRLEQALSRVTAEVRKRSLPSPST